MPTAALHPQPADEWGEADRAAGPLAPLTDPTVEGTCAIRTIHHDRRPLLLTRDVEAPATVTPVLAATAAALGAV